VHCSPDTTNDKRQSHSFACGPPSEPVTLLSALVHYKNARNHQDLLPASSSTSRDSLYPSYRIV